MRFIKSPLIRNVYNLFWGVCFFIFFTREWAYFILANILLVYLVVALLGKKSFWLVFVISFGFLSYCHIYRLMVNLLFNEYFYLSTIV